MIKSKEEESLQSDKNQKKLIDEFHSAIKNFKKGGFYVESNLALHNDGGIQIGISVTNDPYNNPPINIARPVSAPISSAFASRNNGIPAPASPIIG